MTIYFKTTNHQKLINIFQITLSTHHASTIFISHQLTTYRPTTQASLTTFIFSQLSIYQLASSTHPQPIYNYISYIKHKGNQPPSPPHTNISSTHFHQISSSMGIIIWLSNSLISTFVAPTTPIKYR